MEIKEAKEMAIKAQEARRAQLEKIAAMLRAYAGERIMPQIDAAAAKGKNAVKCDVADIAGVINRIELRNIMRDHGYKAEVEKDGVTLVLEW